MSFSAFELNDFVSELAASPELWRHLVRHSAHDRLYQQIWDERDVNAWLICWSDAQDTGFHDHDDSAAAIIGIEGEVVEERMRLDGPPQAHVLDEGSAVFVPASAIHRIRHAGGPPAVTIHAYSPPLRRTGAYRVGPAGELERISQSFEHELRAELALT
jgi:quercetin dioxygenase-like cupin family protein